MEDTATPETGPVDAPASIESITAEIEAGGGNEPADDLEAVTQELVNEAEGQRRTPKRNPEPRTMRPNPPKTSPRSRGSTPEEAKHRPVCQASHRKPDLTVKSR